MVPLAVFYIHIVAAAGVFSRRFQEEGFVEGTLAVFFMALLFFVGWTMSGFILALLVDQEGFGQFMDRDALSLVVLTLGELIFYYFFTRDARRRQRATATTHTP